MTLESFEAYLKLQKKEHLTIKAYIENLKIVEKFLGKPLDKTTTREDLEKYLNSIADRSANTIKMRMITLKIFFKWLYKSKEYPEMVDFKLPKIKGNGLVSSDLLSEEEILRLIKECDNPRDRAIVSLLYDSGCRIGEISDLNIEDVVVEDRTGYIVVDGKTGRRQVPISFSIPDLKVWLNHSPLRDDPQSPLFISNRMKKRMSKQDYGWILDKYAKRIGLNKRIFPHLFRHSRATALEKKGLGSSAMKSFFGWAKNSNQIATYSHLASGDVKALVYEVDGVIQPKEKKKILEPVICPKCNTPNDKTNKFCFLCGFGLDENSLAELEAKKEFMSLIFEEDIWKLLQDKIENKNQKPHLLEHIGS